MSKADLASYVVVQHNYGIGHVVRAAQLAAIARRHGRTFLVCGGPRLGSGLRTPGVECVWLAGLQRATLQDRDLCPSEPGRSLETVNAKRLNQLLELFSRFPPKLLITEYFPFSPKRLEALLIPALEEVRRRWPECQVVSSIRDVPVSDHEVVCAPRVRQLLGAYFDLVLSHADPSLVSYLCVPEYADINEVPLIHTGILVRSVAPGGIPRREKAPARVLVTAGGGRDGKELLCLAARSLAELVDVRATLVAGPRMPPADVEACRSLAERARNVVFFKEVDDLRGRLGRFDLVVSQAGYNTTAEALAAEIPMLLCPRERSTEQGLRARALEHAGAAMVCSLDSSPAELATKIGGAIARPPTVDVGRFDVSGERSTSRALEAFLS